MRKVVLSNKIWGKLDDLKDYLINDLKLSENAAIKRIDRIGEFLKALSAPADYSLGRFKKWNKMGYRCVVFEKDWVFAYEVFEQGVIVRDMSHTSMLTK